MMKIVGGCWNHVALYVGYNIIIYQAIVVTVCCSLSAVCKLWADHTHCFAMGFTNSIKKLRV